VKSYCLILAVLVMAGVGCVSSDVSAPAVADPFCHPDCQPGFCPPDQCPPGCCPPQRGDYESHGIEVGADAPYPVNAYAQNETKSMGTMGTSIDSPDDDIKTGNCIPCRQPVVPHHHPAMAPQRIVPQPTIAPQRAVSPADEVKQGSFQCEKCKRPTVGQQWQEIWADDGTSLLCICKECYRTSTPLQREVVLRNYLSRSGIDPATRPLLEATIKEASRGY
jgi:ribosomal protein L37AE/L43A